MNEPIQHHLFFDDRLNYSSKNTFYYQGANFQLLDSFCDFILERVNKISRIYVCFYLFNNPIVADMLANLSTKGISIKVVSIPLEGYDTTDPKDLLDKINRRIVEENVSKHSMAVKRYEKLSSGDYPNIDLFVFPHMYVRSKFIRPFSRGRLPYSLHTKSFYFEYKDGSGFYGLTSSNFATRDLSKNELLIIKEGSASDNKVVKFFFEDLIANSINYCNFDQEADYSAFRIDYKEAPSGAHTMFTAPFYSFSPSKLDEYLTRTLSSAKDRILVCAQHISVNDGDGIFPRFIGSALEAANRGVTVAFLSQTHADSESASKGRTTKNTKSFKAFLRLVEDTSGCHYYVNESVHDKYIVCDDTVIFTTHNYTPTQFAYVEEVNIENFFHDPEYSYHGTFAEVGQAIVVNSVDLSNQVALRMKEVCLDMNTIRKS